MTSTKQTFYSNGKLLITAEYLVLDGATALALPTKFGQNLVVENGQNHEIVWTSFDFDGKIWFKTVILFSEIINFIDLKIESEKTTLIKILHEAYLKSPSFLTNANGYIVETNLTFPKVWGLGTSSTLINNIAQWTAVDAFELLKNSFGGSGYDIACAQNNKPILYTINNQNPVVNTIDFEPKCSDNIYFVYLNQKQSSKAAIASYYKKNKNLVSEKDKINQITDSILNNSGFENWSVQMQLHEEIMSSVLEMPTVKASLFNDFSGEVKSLGAWGGDFVMVVSLSDPTDYFKKKGFETIVTYAEMIL